MKSKLILGTVQFGLQYGINNSDGLPSLERVIDVLNYAKSEGIDTLDTAAVYGQAEQRIGLYHKKFPNGIFAVNTKFNKDNTITWEESLRNSIDLMGIEQIDTMMFHSFEHYNDHRQDLVSIHSVGVPKYFKRIGVSVYTNEELQLLLSDKLVSVVQLPFNMLDNEALRMPILKELKKAGKEIHTRSSFLQGLFFKDLGHLPNQLQELHPYLSLIRTLASGNGYEIGHLALQYCLSKEYIDKVIIGVDTTAQLKLNLMWSEEQIAPDILSQIDKIRVENIDLLNPSKW